MTIGERKIRGIIREREEAEADLRRSASAQGHVASLLTQERPNIFTQKVANIEPGKQIDINIRYFHTLEYGDGWYEFVFPMVVGPRFNPPGSTDGVGALPRTDVARRRRQTDVQYLRPNERSGHDIAHRGRHRRRRRRRGDRQRATRSHRADRRAIGARSARERRRQSRTRISSCATRSPARRSSRPDDADATRRRSRATSR